MLPISRAVITQVSKQGYVKVEWESGRVDPCLCTGVYLILRLLPHIVRAHPWFPFCFDGSSQCITFSNDYSLDRHRKLAYILSVGSEAEQIHAITGCHGEFQLIVAEDRALYVPCEDELTAKVSDSIPVELKLYFDRHLLNRECNVPCSSPFHGGPKRRAYHEEL